jgi:hypothetical protein
MSSSFWTTIGLGSILAAILGWLAIKSVMIANHRQAWINGLRDDLAEFFTNIDAIYFFMAKQPQSGSAANLEDQQKTRRAVLLSHRRILMRLNMTGQLHQDLEETLQPLLVVRGQTVDQQELGRAVSLARRVLKHEWEVTKYGMFTTPIVHLKRIWKWLFR